MIRVVAPSRLHFGLFHVPSGDHPPAEQRIFGGVGLMIDQPGVVVAARVAASSQFEGVLASRAQHFATRFLVSLPECRRRAFQVLVERCPREHIGLGVGTQLALAVAKALAVAGEEGDGPAVTLAERVGRGERSAVGVHGFDAGGLIIEAGKQPGETISPLLAHVNLPTAWRVVLFIPPVAGRWYGVSEQRAFAAATDGQAEILRTIAEQGILPAARRGDLPAFGEAVYEFNRKAGEPFAVAQGGVYASRDVAELIAAIRRCGIHAVGQSSWGPTVFAVVEDSASAQGLIARWGQRIPAFVARIATGHRVEKPS
ncbi:MAG: hypothetical protein RMJ56_14835 [Gemmataceae bacterium]|nr:hypothetical protein [Gemmata sp.]MDW8198871.1 hypothetical protein [Gemmataceae bacterium]